jgi:hypothetical protein
VSKVQVRLDGKDWPLVVTTNVLCDLEEMTGLNTLGGVETSLVKPSARMVRAWLWLCLREQGATYTLEEVGALINHKNIKLIITALTTAYINSMVPVEEVEQDQADPIKAVG